MHWQFFILHVKKCWLYITNFCLRLFLMSGILLSNPISHRSHSDFADYEKSCTYPKLSIKWTIFPHMSMPHHSENFKVYHIYIGLEQTLMDLMVPEDERASKAHHVLHRARLILYVLNKLVTLLLMIVVQFHRVTSVNKFLLWNQWVTTNILKFFLFLFSFLPFR